MHSTPTESSTCATARWKTTNLFAINCFARHRALLEGSRQYERIHELEERGDRSVREIYDRLNRTFITPIDPEDVGSITVAMEDLLDAIDGLAFRLCAYALDPAPPAVNEVTQDLNRAAERIHGVFEALRDKEMKGKDEIRAKCQEIRQLASESIHQVRDRVVDLYKKEQNCTRLMQAREIYEYLEACAKQCARFTDVVQNVVAKNM